jgi:hypothetical protein
LAFMVPMESTFGFRKRALFLFFLLFPVIHATKAAGVTTSTLMVGSSRVDLTIDASEAPISESDVTRWVKSAAESVSAYYGRFPVPHLTLRIVTFDGSGVRHGMTWAREGGLIRIRVGGKTSAAELADDWMLTHEMIHLAFPSMSDEHHWIEEGLSVYVEPIARIEAGHWTALQMWRDLVRDMPKGLPQEGDEGLDHTHTWGRTYWGGALFSFVADVQIRQQTKNTKGLQDALRGILDAGGDIREDWDIEKALKVADHAVGVQVLQKLYAEWKDKPVQVDLSSMWKELGIEGQGANVRLSDDAPQAAIRRAIDMGSAGPKAAAASGPGTRGGQATRPVAVFAGRTTGKSSGAD